MRLSLLLWALTLIIKRSLKKNAGYRKHVGTMQVRLMVKTADGKHGRLLVFDRGSFSSRRGTRHPFDTALIWSDSGTAFRTMSAKDSETATFRAAADGKVRVEGQVPYLQWFNDGMKLVMK
jgi:hypothetical protein